jgi:DNA polymerase-2
MILEGWFFDVYPVHNGMVVWLVDANGDMHTCFDPFHPTMYLYFAENCRREEQKVAALVRKHNLAVTMGRARKTELFSGREIEVVSITVRDPLAFNQCVWMLQSAGFPHFVFYNSNIPVAQMYLYDRQVFPLAFGKYVMEENSSYELGYPVLERIILEDSFDSWDYRVPDLRVMKLQNGTFAAKFSRTVALEVRYDGKEYAIEENDPVRTLHAFNEHLRRYDPHIIISSWGDASLLPTLSTASAKFRVPLLLNRNQSQEYFTTKDRQYWTYGQVVHRDSAFMLAGRWHIDRDNSFFMGESDIEGIIELARLTQLPMQKQSRAAIGTGLASMQMSYAYKNNILIPAEKKEGEDFKTAGELLLSDRGGLVFMPELGYHEQIAELDFASMYPSLMQMHNISPETIGCSCCRNTKVPELGYTICEKRRGIVPVTLKPVIEKRAYYKARSKSAKTVEERQRYKDRQNALKWMLVTCFGYLGYKNARFGRIEAHEAVNAFSRDTLLQAKEIAEADGYHLVHAIIDCVWLKKPGATEEDYRKLCARIKQVVGVDISLEGIYSWILFPASKTDPGIPTAGKYVGWYLHGDMKMRGIEARRKDTPIYIKTMQQRLLELLSGAEGVQGVKRCIPDLLDEAAFFLGELRKGRVDPRELVMRRRITKEANEYANNNLSALVTRELKEFGITVKAGDTIEYIILDQSGKRNPQKAKSLLTYECSDGYDIEKYTELFLKALETLLGPFGYGRDVLAEYYGVGEKKKARELIGRKAIIVTTIEPYLFSTHLDSVSI